MQTQRISFAQPQGTRRALFVPEVSFEVLVKRQIERLLPLSQRCVEVCPLFVAARPLALAMGTAALLARVHTDAIVHVHTHARVTHARSHPIATASLCTRSFRGWC